MEDPDDKNASRTRRRSAKKSPKGLGFRLVNPPSSRKQGDGSLEDSRGRQDYSSRPPTHSSSFKRGGPGNGTSFQQSRWSNEDSRQEERRQEDRRQEDRRQDDRRQEDRRQESRRKGSGRPDARKPERRQDDGWQADRWQEDRRQNDKWQEGRRQDDRRQDDRRQDDRRPDDRRPDDRRQDDRRQDVGRQGIREGARPWTSGIPKGYGDRREPPRLRGLQRSESGRISYYAEEERGGTNLNLAQRFEQERQRRHQGYSERNNYKDDEILDDSYRDVNNEQVTSKLTHQLPHTDRPQPVDLSSSRRESAGVGEPVPPQAKSAADFERALFQSLPHVTSGLPSAAVLGAPQPPPGFGFWTESGPTTSQSRGVMDQAVMNEQRLGGFVPPEITESFLPTPSLPNRFISSEPSPQFLPTHAQHQLASPRDIALRPADALISSEGDRLLFGRPTGLADLYSPSVIPSRLQQRARSEKLAPWETYAPHSPWMNNPPSGVSSSSDAAAAGPSSGEVVLHSVLNSLNIDSDNNNRAVAVDVDSHMGADLSMAVSPQPLLGGPLTLRQPLPATRRVIPMQVSMLNWSHLWRKLPCSLEEFQHQADIERTSDEELSMRMTITTKETKRLNGVPGVPPPPRMPHKWMSDRDLDTVLKFQLAHNVKNENLQLSDSRWNWKGFKGARRTSTSATVSGKRPGGPDGDQNKRITSTELLLASCGGKLKEKKQTQKKRKEQAAAEIVLVDESSTAQVDEQADGAAKKKTKFGRVGYSTSKQPRMLIDWGGEPLVTNFGDLKRTDLPFDDASVVCSEWTTQVEKTGQPIGLQQFLVTSAPSVQDTPAGDICFSPLEQFGCQCIHHLWIGNRDIPCCLPSSEPPSCGSLITEGDSRRSHCAFMRCWGQQRLTILRSIENSLTLLPESKSQNALSDVQQVTNSLLGCSTLNAWEDYPQSSVSRLIQISLSSRKGLQLIGRILQLMHCSCDDLESSSSDHPFSVFHAVPPVVTSTELIAYQTPKEGPAPASSIWDLHLMWCAAVLRTLPLFLRCCRGADRLKLDVPYGILIKLLTDLEEPEELSSAVTLVQGFWSSLLDPSSRWTIFGSDRFVPSSYHLVDHPASFWCRHYLPAIETQDESEITAGLFCKVFVLLGLSLCKLSLLQKSPESSSLASVTHLYLLRCLLSSIVSALCASGSAEGSRNVNAYLSSPSIDALGASPAFMLIATFLIKHIDVDIPDTGKQKFTFPKSPEACFSLNALDARRAMLLFIVPHAVKQLLDLPTLFSEPSSPTTLPSDTDVRAATPFVAIFIEVARVAESDKPVSRLIARTLKTSFSISDPASFVKRLRDLYDEIRKIRTRT